MHRLIESIFNDTFSESYKTYLIGGFDEPLYKAHQGDADALICYREDYVSSALHEVAHWCIAGSERRKQDDFGYWYHPDGRNLYQQSAFEGAEVKPQALEWLFSLAVGIPFKISVDNLTLENHSSVGFKNDVRQQASKYLVEGLPQRAGLFITALEGLAKAEISETGILVYEDLLT